MSNIKSQLTIIFILLGMFAININLKAVYDPTKGRFLSRDPIEESGGNNLYAITANNPVDRVDILGNITFEQLNKIAKQMGLTPLKTPKGAATKLVKDIQKKLGFKKEDIDGDFGSGTVAKYETWANNNGKTPIKLRDSRTAKQVLTYIARYWPTKHKCLKYCPIGIGEFLTLIFYESKDVSTRKNGKITYFNAIGGPYGTKNLRTTAVGLAQLTEATAPRKVAYSGDLSIWFALKVLLFPDAARKNCNFEWKNRGLNRWEAWKSENTSILTKGKKINDLIKKHKGEIGSINNSDLNKILGIK